MRAHLIVVFILSACSHPIFSVSATPNGGIPFYPVQVTNTTVIAYEQVWYEVALSATMREVATTLDAEPPRGATTPAPSGVTAGPKPREYDKQIYFFTTDAAAANAAVKWFGGEESARAAWIRIARMSAAERAQFADAPPPPLAWKDVPSNTAIVSVTHTRGTRPGPRPMYLNSRTPWAGTGKASFELAADGTLRKLEGEQADNLPGTVASVISAVAGSGALTALVGPSAAPSAPEASTAKKLFNALTGMFAPDADSAQYVAAKITVTPIRRIYVIASVVPMDEEGKAASAATTCDIKAELPRSVDDDDACQVSLTVRIVRGDSAGASDDGKSTKGDSAVKFSGSISLPTAKPGED